MGKDKIEEDINIQMIKLKSAWSEYLAPAQELFSW